MVIYVVRHGEAAAAAPGEADGTRSLTEQGRREVAEAGAGLRALGVALDRILVSPLRRAQQTAELLARGLAPDPNAEPTLCETLTELDGSESPAVVLATLGRLRQDETVAIVGHMPGLGELVALATTADLGSGVHFSTASVARLDFEARVRPGGGQLRWLRSAQQLGDARRARHGRPAI